MFSLPLCSPFFRPPWLGLAAFLTAVVAHAGEAPTSAFTLADALTRAAERNPSLAARSYTARAASALVDQAGVRPNPTLELEVENVLGTGRTQGLRSSETTVQASQTFERGGKREKRVAVASRERDVAEKEFNVFRTEILAAAATAYVSVLAAQERLALAGEAPRLARETVTTIETHVNAGVASASELARARAALALATAEQGRAQAALTSARATLAATWGGLPHEVPTLAGNLRTPDALPEREPQRERLAAHPRLDWQAAIIASRRASLVLEQARSQADLTASGGLRFLREGSDAAFVGGISVPLATRKNNQGQIRAGRESLTGAEQSARALESELQTAFASAWGDLAAAHATALALRRDALPPTEDAYAAVQRAYAAGPIPLTDVLDAQRALIALRREILTADADYAAALVRVEALTHPAFPATTALISSR